METLVKRSRDEKRLIKGIYVAVLSRLPAKTEYETAREYIRDSGLNEEAAAGDLMWALINTKEFMFRHKLFYKKRKRQ